MNKELIEVNLDPQSYSNVNKFSPLESINNKWFLNLSQYNIPKKVQCLLQLEQNFSLPSLNTNNNELIKNIENNIIKLHSDTQTEVRNRSISLIHNLMSTPLPKDHTDVKIIKYYDY